MPLFEWHRKRSLQLLHSKGKIIGNLKNNSNLLYIYISFFPVKIDSPRLGPNHFMSRQRFTIKQVNDCTLACVMTSPPLHKSSLERKPVKLLFFKSRCLKNTKFILYETETKQVYHIQTDLQMTLAIVFLYGYGSICIWTTDDFN